ncbi:unnamed protein product, partial [Ectocarpus sp. 12 AP-2014]
KSGQCCYARNVFVGRACTVGRARTFVVVRSAPSWGCGLIAYCSMIECPLMLLQQAMSIVTVAPVVHDCWHPRKPCSGGLQWLESRRKQPFLAVSFPLASVPGLGGKR